MEVTNDNSCSWIQDLIPRTNIKTLQSKEDCEWLVIGAGYTGLSAARKLGQLYPNQKIILVDAGHGGEDSGAVRKNKSLEKNVNLAIAKKLVAIINQNKDFKAVLSRSGDYYVPLTKRLTIAQQQKASMFISIHADSVESISAKGASVYMLSEKGNNSKLAKQLEASQNLVDQFGGVEGVFAVGKNAGTTLVSPGVRNGLAVEHHVETGTVLAGQQVDTDGGRRGRVATDLGLEDHVADGLLLDPCLPDVPTQQLLAGNHAKVVAQVMSAECFAELGVLRTGNGLDRLQ